jgi:SAM-dependent methyltransferase
MRKPRSRLTALLHRYRTEGDTPVRQALAIALGLYIGASPFVGFHLALALGLGWLFGLNRFKVYVAANISNPIVAPFLYAVEIQVGTRLRTGQFLSPSRLDEIRLAGIAIDVLIGSVIVGLILAIAGGLLTYWGSGGRDRDPSETVLVSIAAERYLSIGCGAWELARAKLQADPVYLQVIRDGRLPTQGTLMDLGCGQGLMLALIAATRELWQRGQWPPSWPPPPLNLELRGIETRPRVARHAREALDDVARIEQIDLTLWSLPPCDAILLFDVMHLLPRETQDRLLTTAARSLSPSGVLIIREADAAGGWKFNMVRAGNRFNAFAQGHFRRRFCFDSLRGWSSRLEAEGFTVESVTRHDSPAFANVLLQARLADRRDVKATRTQRQRVSGGTGRDCSIGPTRMT